MPADGERADPANPCSKGGTGTGGGCVERGVRFGEDGDDCAEPFGRDAGVTGGWAVGWAISGDPTS